jgi:hypothetical protein
MSFSQCPILTLVVNKAAQKLLGLRIDAVHARGINFNATIQSTGSFLKVDRVAVFEQIKVMEIINKRQLPRVVRIDFLRIFRFNYLD